MYYHAKLFKLDPQYLLWVFYCIVHNALCATFPHQTPRIRTKFSTLCNILAPSPPYSHQFLHSVQHFCSKHPIFPPIPALCATFLLQAPRIRTAHRARIHSTLISPPCTFTFLAHKKRTAVGGPFKYQLPVQQASHIPQQLVRTGRAVVVVVNKSCTHLVDPLQLAFIRCFG